MKKLLTGVISLTVLGSSVIVMGQGLGKAVNYLPVRSSKHRQPKRSSHAKTAKHVVKKNEIKMVKVEFTQEDIAKPQPVVVELSAELKQAIREHARQPSSLDLPIIDETSGQKVVESDVLNDL